MEGVGRRVTAVVNKGAGCGSREVDPSCQKKTKTWLKKRKIYREESTSGRRTAKTVSKARKNKDRKTKKSNVSIILQAHCSPSAACV